MRRVIGTAFAAAHPRRVSPLARTLLVGGAVGCTLALAGGRYGFMRTPPIAHAASQLSSQAAAGAGSLSDFAVLTTQGDKAQLSDFADKVLLVVNVASE